MQLAADGTLIVSATDLVGFLACDHLATLELGRVQGLWERPIRTDDPTIALIQEKGDLHESAYLASLRAQGLNVIEIAKEALRTPADLRAAQATTLDAMRAGADVIYQATFFDGRWRGHADFLFRRPDRPGPLLGGWSYDIADTKLARSVKGGAILQMCVYAGLLQGLQGIAPEWLHVITGDGARHPHRDGRLRRLLPARSCPLRCTALGRTGHRLCRDLPGSGGPLPGLHLVPHVHGPPTRGRSPLHRGRDSTLRHGATRRRRGAHAHWAGGP